MNIPEEKFWRMQLKKLLALWGQHCKFNGWDEEDKKEKEVYIDEIPGL